MLGRASDAPMAIWEEDDFEEPLRPLSIPEKLLWKDLTISTGSKAVVMFADTPEEVDWLSGVSEECPDRLSSVPLSHPQAYIDDFLSRMTEEVQFIPLPSDDAAVTVGAAAAPGGGAALPTVTLQLLRTVMYPQMQEALAPELGVSDPSVLRFTRHSNWAEGPEKVPIKTTDERQLRAGSNAILERRDRKHKVYYEKLDRSVSAVEAIVHLKVEVRDRSMHVVRAADPNLTMPDKESCSALGIMEAALASLPEAEPLGAAKPEDMVLLLVKDSTIAEQYGPSTDPLDPHLHHWLYRVEPKVPVTEEECLVQCVHISPLEGYSRPVTHSHPFFLVLRETDTEDQVREAMQRKLGLVDSEGKKVGKDDGSTWNVHLLSQSASETSKLDASDAVLPQVLSRTGLTRGQCSLQPVLAFEHAAPPATRRSRRSQEEAVRFKTAKPTENPSPA
eukprot:Hpha_TRINITY_DN15293_c1_g4::TRINITY_DN15293_c1_g4_i2::g.67554::m.67554